MTHVTAIIREAIAAYRARTGYEHIRPRAALIDMDGTLYDSMSNHATAWQRMMHEIGVEVPHDEFFLYEGMTGAATITHLIGREEHRTPTPEEIKRLYHRKTELFTEQGPVEPMPGAAEVLGQFQRHGLRCVLVTGSGQSSLINRLAADYPGVFIPGDRITSRDVKRGKPSPEPYQRGMQIAGVQPWEAIVLENAPLGVQSGVAAGAFTIGVTTGPIPVEMMRQAGADIIFSSMPECAAAIDQLLIELQHT
ncbi:MAG: HAD-IA family hydrolase [Muribaculaceae bacterium]|nr:HAD-IA family hydrolase [Muribaculaceae bacterium]MDE6322362.1 HAD-IA family hydrolase [Muribaculaceae bacterium]